ncbi:MAG: glycine cleavage system aminomethyltransferase GcvT [Gemmatimonas sp.]
MTSADNPGDAKRTPLFDLHTQLGGKMVPFAGYALPVQYPAGIIAEHLQCRAAAALFDVSHMGQARLHGSGAAAALERLVPADIQSLKPFAQRYTMFTNDGGGILDDLMATRLPDGVFLVVNAACKDADFALLKANLPGDVSLEVLEERALLALQGPAAEAALCRLAPKVAALGFMRGAWLDIRHVPCFVTRSGYTGEDGFEISVPASHAFALAEDLLAQPEVKPAGLGARDTLRLEAGLCLYGHDIDTTTSPIEAGLAWTIQKRRRTEGGFPGAARIQRELADGPNRTRVGIKPDGRAPARDGTEVTDVSGNVIGTVTSGGFGPTVGAPIGMGYVAAGAAKPETPIRLTVRNNAMPGRIKPLPFVPHRYRRPS